jgi:multidrug efflux pump
VLLVVFKRPGSNVIETVDGSMHCCPNCGQPAGLGHAVRWCRTARSTIRSALNEVEIALAIAVGLVILVVFLFLRNARATLIPAVVVPVSLAGSFAVMHLLGFSLNNLSLMALTIATGFVVDDAVVVIENIARHIERGLKPFDAAIAGVREVASPWWRSACRWSRCSFPSCLMGGVVGRLFREFALTLSVAVLVSMVVSLTTTPMMCARLLRPTMAGRRAAAWRRWNGCSNAASTATGAASIGRWRIAAWCC